MVILSRRPKTTRGRSVQRIHRAPAASARALKVGRGRHRAARWPSAFADIARGEGRVDLLINNVGNYNPQDVTRARPGGVGRRRICREPLRRAATAATTRCTLMPRGRQHHQHRHGRARRHPREPAWAPTTTSARPACSC
ncbi:MAG: hypothetical protein MZW92_52865 [Comamonadaceae bacterium]|nr:hypothetical protein [Comamonadaceae bacterium]